MISVFGKNSIDEIEKAIVSEWFDSVSNGWGAKIDKLKDGIKTFWDKSNKLKEWFDVSSLLDYNPGS